MECSCLDHDLNCCSIYRKGRKLERRPTDSAFRLADNWGVTGIFYPAVPLVRISCHPTLPPAAVRKLAGKTARGRIRQKTGGVVISGGTVGRSRLVIGW